MAEDYRKTVFLPQTEFPMRGELPKREPALLARWEKIGLYQRQRAAAKGRKKYVLHDGPPYANGNLHIGHALNKILKDVINRAQQMLGRDAVYVPGWDCHGLPIEWKIEEEYRAKKKSKDEVPILEFRKECRDFAAHWIAVQREEFKRLGVLGDWDHPYTTMEFSAEAQIVREIGKFLMNGGLFRGSKPVMWSVVEQTALAEAEVEYHDHTSTQVWVKFPMAKPSVKALEGASVVIWTTTPWTLPGNRAIAFNEALDYVVIEVQSVREGSAATVGEKLVVAAPLEVNFAEIAKLGGKVELVSGKFLAGTVCRHPLHGKGYDFDVPLLPGDFVTDVDGTGFVHIAPGHGDDDFELGQKHNIPVPATVGPDGIYYDNVPLFAGKHVYWPNGKTGDANKAVIAALTDVHALLGQAPLVHSYPHSWRSKAPLIFRTTPQWFIGMEKNDLREKALKAIAETKWYPPQGQNRIGAMIETRPDWCISRQRAWGVPIAVFVEKKSGEVLRDQAVVDRIAAAFEKEGADAWYARDPAEFLGPGRDPKDYEQIKDVVDVWFDSGSTHSFVLEQRPDLCWPASLYLEGSDQHRGWFHSSLLESCGTRGRAPYEAVLTHGFLLDEQGPQDLEIIGRAAASVAASGRRLGADILRLWVVNSDYSEDVTIGSRNSEIPGRRLSPIAQHVALSLGRAGGIFRAGARRGKGYARARALYPSSPRRDRCAGARDGGRLRLPHHVHGVAQSLRGRSLRLLFRCAQGCALLRRAGCRAPPCDAHRARSCVRASRALARAGALLHRRRSVAQPPWRRGRIERPSPALSRYPRRLARRGAGCEMGEDPRIAPRRHRRHRAGAGAEAHRLQPSGGGRDFRDARLGRAAGGDRFARALHYFCGAAQAWRGAGGCVYAWRCAGGRRAGNVGAGRQMRAVLARLA